MTTESVDQSSAREDANTKAPEAAAKKIRITLLETEDGPLTRLQNKLKERGLKNIDLGEIVSEALGTVDETFWDEKINALTPLEFRLQAALDNPEMKQKLIDLLDDSSVH